jgi:hypothetical protein
MNSLNIFATTYGNGPYYPAIRDIDNGITFWTEIPFDREEDAHSHAAKLLSAFHTMLCTIMTPRDKG